MNGRRRCSQLSSLSMAFVCQGESHMPQSSDRKGAGDMFMPHESRKLKNVQLVVLIWIELPCCCYAMTQFAFPLWTQN